jgi:hypothetical protein
MALRTDSFSSSILLFNAILQHVALLTNSGNM